MSFQELLDLNLKINPLDLILINSPDLKEELIFTFENKNFNHIGIAITSAVLPEYCPDKDKIYVIESIFNNNEGVRVVSWNRLQRENISLHHPLKDNPWLNSTFTIRTQIKTSIRNILANKEPERSYWNPFYTLYQVFQGLYNRIFPIQTKKTICSIPVAKILMSLNIFPNLTDINCVTPENLNLL